MKRFKQRIDHGDVIESPSGEFYLVSDVDARIVELENALQSLCDEQNGPPLETRREQWQRAYDQARALLRPSS